MKVIVMSNHAHATFKTRAAAEACIVELERLGVTEQQISVIASDETRGKSFNLESHSKAAEGTGIGAATGGLVGAVLGGLATAGAMAVPGLNVVVSGALVSALAGLGAGAATGGLVGGLVGAGITEHEAKIYEDEIKNGAVLIAVEANDKDQQKRIKEVFERQDAHNVAA